MAVLLRNHRPLYFFSVIALILMALAGAYGLAWALGVLPPWRALVVLGLVLNAVNAGFREIVALNRRPS
jgi:hypothetical protein